MSCGATRDVDCLGSTVGDSPAGSQTVAESCLSDVVPWYAPGPRGEFERRGPGPDTIAPVAALAAALHRDWSGPGKIGPQAGLLRP